MYKKNAWLQYTKQELEALFAFNEEYKEFITKAKTERECVELAVEIFERNGFKNLNTFKSIKPGDKIYATNRGKNIACFTIGDKPLSEGINILGAHIDSPRIDLKQNPLYEKNGFAMLDTHYYGGIIKYQWVTRPLAMHGVVVKKDGFSIYINIGEDPNDPVVMISDLLPHLDSDKREKPARAVIDGEDLDITIGNMPLPEETEYAVKENISKILKDKYNIDKEDFVSAEIEIVPAGPARDLGLDRSMILGYGHDDRVCAYTSLMALLDQGKCEHTTCAICVDKEEVGSIGATGAESKWFENIIAELVYLEGKGDTNIILRRTISNSRMLSSDVSAADDPLYMSVFSPNNGAKLGEGICFNKYTGVRGKSTCNDASPEFIAKIRNMMDNNDICYQTSELGKVDAGGGGTIAYILGNSNMDVIDAGVPVLAMHSPCEVVSKVDVYEAYLAYKIFLKEAKYN